MGKIGALVVFMLIGSTASAQFFQTNGAGGGTWSVNTTWLESTDGIQPYLATLNVPTSANSVDIQIIGNDVVTVTGPVTIDGTTVGATATLTVSSTTLTLANNTNALVVNGTVTVTGTGAITNPAAANFQFNNLSHFIHNRNGGIVPPATWITGSECNIAGITNTVPTGLTQSFHDFTWNATTQSATINLAGNLTTVTGNLSVSSTNGNQLQFATTTALVIAITGDLLISGNSRVAFVTTGTGATINVGGNFNYQSTNATGSPLKTTGSYTLNVTGGFDMNATGGLLLLSGGNGNTGTMNLTGNFSLTAGTLSETGNGRGAVNFVGSGTQTFTNTGSITLTIDFTISSTSTLDVLNESPLGSATATGTFTLNGTIRLGSLNTTGALITGRTAGNVMTNGTRTFGASSRVVYAGTGAQFIGSGHPTTVGVTTEIDNAAGVTFNTTTVGNSAATILTIPGILELTNGNLSVASTATARGLVLSTDILNTGGAAVSFSGANSDLTVNGVGDFGVFPFPAGAITIRNFTMNRTGGAGAVQFGNDVLITSTTTLTSGTLSFDGQNLTLGNVGAAGGNYSSAGGQLASSGGSVLTLNGSTALASPLNFDPLNNTLQDLILNKSNAGLSVTISSALNVSNALTVLNGQLSITGSALSMGNAPVPTITLNSAGSITTSSPAGGPWNLIYSGTTAINPTGFEIPVSGSLVSLTASNTSTITLDQILVIGVGGFTQTSGTFNAGANAISTAFLTITAGTFTAPSSTLTLNGGLNNDDLTIDGTFTNNAGTVVFGGTADQTILGTAASTTNFRNITINPAAELVSPTTLNIQGDFFNQFTFTPGVNTVNFSGGNAQAITGTDAGFFNFTVNKSANTLSVNSAQTINNNLTLTAGTLSIATAVDMPNASSVITLTAGTMAITGNLLTLADGATISRAAGTITTSSPGGGPWNLTYTGATKTTAFEIPTLGAIKNLTVNTNNATTVTLAVGQPLNVSGIFTIQTTGRIFTSGANNVSVGGFSNAGTFNAPTAGASNGMTLAFTGTFTPGTFTSTGTVRVGAGFTITMTGASPQFFNFVVDATGTFIAPATLNINSTLTNDGTFTAGTGLVNIVSTTLTKTINGSAKITLNNLTVNGNVTANPDLINENTVGIDLGGILNMTTAANSTFDADGAGGARVLTLLSTGPVTSGTFTTQDASIAQMSVAAGQVTGNVSVQRYMNRQGVGLYNFQVWRNISSPVATTVADIQQELPVIGSFPQTDFIPGQTGDPSMYSYSELVTGDLENGYVAFPVADASEALSPGRGYSIFIFGSDVPVSTNLNSQWAVSGTVNSGTLSMPVTFTSSAPTVLANDGWNLVGNPYASTIDWLSAGWTKTNMDDAIYMSDYSTANPVFASFVAGVGTNGGSRFIATGQGFWVKANAAAPVLTIRETVKVAGTQTTFFRQSGPTDLIRIALSRDNLTDEAVIYFSDSATIAFDSKYDARKFRNPYWYLNLSTISANEKYSINAMPLSACAAQVPLDVSDVTTGTYQLSFTEFESMSSAMKIQFRDNFTNALIDVRLNPNYPFSVDETDPNTFGSDRFSLAFTYEGGLVTIASETPGVCDTGTGLVNVTNSSSDYDYSLIKPSTGAVVVAPTQGEDGPLRLYIPADQITAGQNQFQVKAANRYCTNLESTLLVSINYAAVPAAVTVTAGTSCGTGHAVISASGAPADGHYNWYDSLEAVSPIPNEILAIYTTPELTSSKAYYVAAVNILGCEGPWVEVMANVSNLDPAVIEIVNAFTLQSNYQTGNQWYLDGNLIPGATNNTLQAVQSGVYRLDVTLNGCTVTDSKVFAVTAIEPSNSGAAGITIYPNPVKETLRVSVDADAKPVGSMYNLMGAYVGPVNFESSGSRYKGEYSFNKESSGFYFLRVERGSKVDVVRIIKD